MTHDRVGFARVLGWSAAGIALSLWLPAVTMGNEVLRGWAMVVMSAMLSSAVFSGDVKGRDDVFFILTCLCGLLANASFLIGMLLFLLRTATPLRRPSHTATAVIAGFGLAAAAASGLRLLSDVNVAFYVWLASFAALLAASIMLRLADRDAGRIAARGFDVVLPLQPHTGPAQ